MQIGFTVRIASGSKKFDGVDQYPAALSLFGISQMLMISLNAFFNRDVITQAPSAKGFRLVMGLSKKGSWEQQIAVVVTDPLVQQTLEELGKNALYDLLKWALTGSLGIPFVLQYRKSIRRARELERENEDLHEKLDEALKRAHAPVKYQGLSLQITTGRTVLATYDEMTLQYLETEVLDDETHLINCAISRFNARTSTGRLISSMDSSSVPFFPVEKLPQAQNTLLADNLAQVARGIYTPVGLLVSRITDADGRLKRYRLHRAMRV